MTTIAPSMTLVGQLPYILTQKGEIVISEIVKKKSILKNKDKPLFQRDVSSSALLCTFFFSLSLLLAYFAKYVLGFSSRSTEFFGSVYLISCVIEIFIIYFINKDYIFDRNISREKMTGKAFCSGFSSMITFMILATFGAIFVDVVLKQLGYTLISVAPANTVSDSITETLYTCLVGPICEEIIFRGYVQRKLEKYSPVVAVFTSAIFFALYHGNFGQMFPMIGVGLVLGYMAYKYSIRMSMIMHVTYNTVFGELFGLLSDFLSKGGDDFKIPLIDMTPFSLAMSILSIIGVLVMANLYRKDKFPFKEYRIKLKNALYSFTSSGMMIFTTAAIVVSIILIDKA